MRNKLPTFILVSLFAVSTAFGASRLTTWSSGQILTASNLNAEFSNVTVSGTILRTGGAWNSADDIPVGFGSADPDARIEWETTQTTDSLIIGLGTGLIMNVMELADMSTDWGISSQTNPTLYLHSADATATTDYIYLTHDQTNAVVGVGSGVLDIQADVQITGTTPVMEMGDDGAEDTQINWAGNETDFSFGLDDSTNSLVWADEIVLGTDNLFELFQVGTATSVQRARLYGSNPGTPADNDETYLSFFAENDSPAQVEIARMSWMYLDVSAADDDSTLTFDVFINNSFTEVLSLGSSSNTATAGRATITGELNVSGAVTFTTDLTVANGGTGASSLTDGGVLLGSGTGAITATAVLGDGVILIGDASGDPATLDVGSSSGITVLGTVATGVWQGTDVGVAYGGTGASSLTDGGVLLGSGTGAVTATAVLADGEILIGDGSTDPVALDIGSSSSITVLGTVATGTWQATDVGVAYGGTGASSLTDGGILLGSGTGAITALGAAANGQIPIGDGTTDPVLATLTGTANEVTVTNGGGSVTLSIPDASIFVTPRSTGAAEFNSTVLIGANGTTLDGHVHILSPSTSTVGLVVEMPSSASADMQDWQYSGSKVGSFFASGTTTRFAIASRDLGDDNAGPNLFIGYNNNSTNANAGYIILFDAGGGDNYIWVDNSAGPPGDLRISNGPPAASTSDTSGTIVGTQSSPRYIKNVLYTYSQEPDDRVYEKLQVVLDTEIMDWEYKSGQYGQMFTGLAVPDGEHPWYGLDPVTSENDLAPMGTAKALNQLNIPGYLILSIKALNKKIERLENEVSRLRTSRSIAGM
jgi:hypothetical protein